MTISEIAQLVHVTVSENKIGTVKISTDEGYWFMNEIKQPILPPTLSEENSTEEATETEIIKNFSSIIYTRTDSVLLEYTVVTEAEKQVYEEKQAVKGINNQIN